VKIKAPQKEICDGDEKAPQKKNTTVIIKKHHYNGEDNFRYTHHKNYDYRTGPAQDQKESAKDRFDSWNK
jgi:hypothetical protein